MQPSNPLMKFLLFFGAPLILIMLCSRPVLGNTPTAPTHPDHQFALAIQYHHGDVNLKKDPLLAIYWYEQAALQGHREAQSKLGHLLCVEYTAINEFQRGFDWLKKAAEQGDIQAQYQVGYIYLEGGKTQQDLNLARSWLERAAQSGHSDAKRMLVFCTG